MELKDAGGKLEPKQVYWQDLLAVLGYSYVVCWSQEEGFQEIRKACANAGFPNGARISAAHDEL